MLLVLQVPLKGLLVEKLKSTLIKQLEKQSTGEILYVSYYTMVRCEARGRSTKAATAATGEGTTRRGVAISSICGGASSTHCCASCGAVCVCIYL